MPGRRKKASSKKQISFHRDEHRKRAPCRIRAQKGKRLNSRKCLAPKKAVNRREGKLAKETKKEAPEQNKKVCPRKEGTRGAF